MFDPSDLEDFLKAPQPTSRAVPGSVVFFNNRLDAETDEACSVTDMPGLPALDVEQAFDKAFFQLRFRAPKNNNAKARENARIADERILDDSLRPLYIGGHYVMDLNRTGGGPSYLGTDHQNRANYACTYFVTIARL